jgi:hypothetical protein
MSITLLLNSQNATSSQTALNFDIWKKRDDNFLRQLKNENPATNLDRSIKNCFIKAFSSAPY